jgi:hypothetical protein
MSETHDAQGREVFTVHPEILAGGAAYRSVKREPAQQDVEQPDQGAARRGRRQHPQTS